MSCCACGCDSVHVTGAFHRDLSSLADTTIQSTTHDSVEDARTALLLYREYQRLAAGDGGADAFRTILKELYDKGRTLKWTIPADHGAVERSVEEERFELDLQEIM